MKYNFNPIIAEVKPKIILIFTVLFFNFQPNFWFVIIFITIEIFLFIFLITVMVIFSIVSLNLFLILFHLVIISYALVVSFTQFSFLDPQFLGNIFLLLFEYLLPSYLKDIQEIFLILKHSFSQFIFQLTSPLPLLHLIRHPIHIIHHHHLLPLTRALLWTLSLIHLISSLKSLTLQQS